MGHPAVKEACVVGIPHPKWQERPVAFVVPKPEYADTVTAEEIRVFLTDKVARGVRLFFTHDLTCAVATPRGGGQVFGVVDERGSLDGDVL